MMIKGIADTHAIIWSIFNDSHLSLTARNFIQTVATDNHQIGISSITLAEIIYLTEKGRIPVDTLTRILNELDLPESSLVEVPFERKIALAMRSIDRRKIPDLHDRMIAATALEQGVPLISRDAKIQVSGITTIW